MENAHKSSTKEGSTQPAELYVVNKTNTHLVFHNGFRDIAPYGYRLVTPAERISQEFTYLEAHDKVSFQTYVPTEVHASKSVNVVSSATIPGGLTYEELAAQKKSDPNLKLSESMVKLAAGQSLSEKLNEQKEEDVYAELATENGPTEPSEPSEPSVPSEGPVVTTSSEDSDYVILNGAKVLRSEAFAKNPATDSASASAPKRSRKSKSE